MYEQDLISRSQIPRIANQLLGCRPRLAEEVFRIRWVSLSIFLISRPVRGELTDRITWNSLLWLENQLTSTLGYATASPLRFLAYALLVSAFVALVQRLTGLQLYVFHCEVDRRLAQVSTRHVGVAIGMVLTLGFALVCRGEVGLHAFALFVVLYAAMRLLRGGGYDVSIHPPRIAGGRGG